MEGIFRFKLGWAWSLKQPKTASTDSLWACIREGLLSEGFLRPRFGGGGGAYFWEGFFLFLGRGGLLSEVDGSYVACLSRHPKRTSRGYLIKELTYKQIETMTNKTYILDVLYLVSFVSRKNIEIP